MANCCPRMTLDDRWIRKRAKCCTKTILAISSIRPRHDHRPQWWKLALMVFHYPQNMAHRVRPKHFLAINSVLRKYQLLTTQVRVRSKPFFPYSFLGKPLPTDTSGQFLDGQGEPLPVDHLGRPLDAEGRPLRTDRHGQFVFTPAMSSVLQRTTPISRQFVSPLPIDFQGHPVNVEETEEDRLRTLPTDGTGKQIFPVINAYTGLPLARNSEGRYVTARGEVGISKERKEQ